MGRVVVRSIESEGKERCVDIFRRDDGTFGFEEWRRDPEDGGRWRKVGFFGNAVFDTAEGATAQAKAHVGWLAGSSGQPR